MKFMMILDSVAWAFAGGAAWRLRVDTHANWHLEQWGADSHLQ
jgi:hypothetical protein